MLGAISWEQVGVAIGVLSPLVGVPLGVITLYLRAIREHQTTATADVAAMCAELAEGKR